MKKSEIKKGQLVKLASDSCRWSDFINTSRVGVILEHDNHTCARILFTDGELEEHWYFSLERVSEIT
jgi:hypothetical protein